MKKLYLILLGLGATGCAWLHTSFVTTKDGVPVYEATCNDVLGTMGDCLRYAHSRCNGEFEMLAKDQNIAGVTTAGVAPTKDNNAYARQKVIEVRRSVLFQCKKDLLPAPAKPAAKSVQATKKGR